MTIENLGKPKMRCSLVQRIGKWSAKSGNEEVFKWAIRNVFYFMELLRTMTDF
jgi:hypothetical protein